MAPWCHANCNVPHEPYQLTAVATHVGTLEHGHNTAIVNNPTVPFWLEFNDKKIKSIPTSAVVVRKVISTYFVPLEH